MKILLDHCVTKRLRQHLPEGHEVKTAYEMGWSALTDGPLLDVAQAEFEVLITTDQNLPHQQNLRGRPIGVIVLVAPSSRLTDLLPLLPHLAPALKRIQSSQIQTVKKPEPSPEMDSILENLQANWPFDEGSTIDLELMPKGTFRVTEVRQDLSIGKQLTGYLYQRLSGFMQGIIYAEVPELTIDQLRIFDSIWMDFSEKLANAEEQKSPEFLLMCDGDYPEVFYPLDTHPSLPGNTKEGMIKVWHSLVDMLRVRGYRVYMQGFVA